MNDTQQIEMVASSAAATSNINPSPSPTILPVEPGISLGIRGETFDGITLEAIGLTLVAGCIIWTITVFAFGVAVMLKHTNIAPRCTARHSNTIWRSKKDIASDENKRRKREALVNNNLAGGESDNSNINNATLQAGNMSTRAQPSTSPKTGIDIEENNNGGMMSGGSTLPLTDPQSKTGANNNFDYNNPINNEIMSNHPSPLSTTASTQQQTQYYYTHPQDRGNPFLGWIPWTLHLSYDRMLRGIPGTGTRNRGMDGSFLGVNLDAIVLFRYNGAFCLYVVVCQFIVCLQIGSGQD